MSAPLRRGLLYAVLALCLMGFCYVQGRADQRDQEALQQAQTLLAGHSGYRRAIDSLKGVEARYVGLEGYYRRLADSLGVVMSRVPSHQPSPGVTPVSDTVAVSAGSTDSLRVIFLGRSLDACDASREAADSALARCGRRADSLETSLRAVLAVKSCRLLGFIPCPSRSALFVLGAVSGAILEHRLSR